MSASPEDKRKQRLRKRLLAARRALPTGEIESKSLIIAARVRQCWEYQQASGILLRAVQRVRWY